MDVYGRDDRLRCGMHDASREAVGVRMRSRTTTPQCCIDGLFGIQ